LATEKEHFGIGRNKLAASEALARSVMLKVRFALRQEWYRFPAKTGLRFFVEASPFRRQIEKSKFEFRFSLLKKFVDPSDVAFAPEGGLRGQLEVKWIVTHNSNAASIVIHRNR